MHILKHRQARWGLLILGVVLLCSEILVQYRHTHQSLPLVPDNIPPEGFALNDTNGKVPGDPAKTLAKARLIYKSIQVYKNRHQGQNPSRASDLVTDMMQNFNAYGVQSADQVFKLFTSPDARYADDPMLRSKPESTGIWITLNQRPDGSPIGGPKSASTADVLAETTLYYHQNLRYFKGLRATMKPVGFYIVVWDNGKVEPIPYSKAIFFKKEGGYGYAFPGQAGVPANAIPFSEYYATIRRPGVVAKTTQ